MRPGGTFVSGYFGSLVAKALVDARVDDDLALEWMRWYVAHAHDSGSGVDGVADDVDLTAHGERSRGRPDATDAYGAVFAMLARDAYDSGTPRLRAFVLAHRADLTRIVNSMLATQQPNGLTFARPQHPVAYTIDNVQVYRGLQAAADLFRRAYHDDERAARYAHEAVRVHDAIQALLWNRTAQSYDPLLDAAGAPPANLARAYPDALAQVMAIYYGMIDPNDPLAADLLERASPALLRNPDPLDEHRLLVLLAQKKLGRNVGIPPFTPPDLCVSAAWYLELTHPKPHASP